MPRRASRIAQDERGRRERKQGAQMDSSLMRPPIDLKFHAQMVIERWQANDQ